MSNILANGKMLADPIMDSRLQIIRDINPAYGNDTETAYTLDESGMAELFSKVYRDTARYCPERKSWYIYNGGKWVKDAESLCISAMVREFVHLLTLYAGLLQDDDARRKWLTFAAKLGGRGYREHVMKDARDDLRIPVAEFDSHPYLINCLNGTYDLKTGKFRAARYEDYITMQTAFEFRKEYGVCARWEQFVKEVTDGDTAKADFLQRALGYTIAGTANEECMFILHGKTTRNGKSTMLNAIEHLLGDYASVASVSIICKTDKAKNAEAATPCLAGLKGKRFVSMAESNQYGRIDEEMVKQLTGGEEISARNLYEAPISYLPQFALWLSCNDLPAVSDKSLFASDRMKVVEFTRHFGEGERDIHLKDIFKTPEAMSGIFVWLAKGYKAYCKRGLEMSNEMRKVIKDYENENDIVLEFLKERTKRSAGMVRAKDLYDTYRIWARDSGYSFVMSRKKFVAEVRTKTEFYEKEKSRDHYVWFSGMEMT